MKTRTSSKKAGQEEAGPYSMCSRQESGDREQHNDVSVFEQLFHAGGDTDAVNDPRQQQQQQQQQHVRNYNHKIKTKNIRRRIDPCKAVTKYRRPAAGMSDKETYPLRTLDQLERAVRYLVSDTFCQAPAILRSLNGHRSSQQPRISFLDCVRFIDDRIRQIQVDLVRHYGGTGGITNSSSSTINTIAIGVVNKQLQHLMTKYHILAMYLLLSGHTNNGGAVSDNEYPRKFVYQALTTSLAQYWNVQQQQAAQQRQDGGDDDHAVTESGDTTIQKTNEMDDMMISYYAIYELVQYLQQLARHEGEDDSNNSRAASSAGSASSLSHVFIMYRKHFVSGRRGNGSCPCWQWTLRLMSDVIQGHWAIGLNRLARGVVSARSEVLTSSNVEGGGIPDNSNSDSRGVNDNFSIMARCLMAPVLRYIRFKALQSYNVAFMKKENVPLEDDLTTRMLYFVDTVGKKSGTKQQQQTAADATTKKSAWDEYDTTNGSNSDGDNNKPNASSSVTTTCTKTQIETISATQQCVDLVRAVGIPIEQRAAAATPTENTSVVVFKSMPATWSHSNQLQSQKQHCYYREDAFCFGRDVVLEWRLNAETQTGRTGNEFDREKEDLLLPPQMFLQRLLSPE